LSAALDGAARVVLGRNAAWIAETSLPMAMREHPGFAFVGEHLLPTPEESLMALALMIKDRNLVGRIGSADDYPIGDAAVLATAGVNLPLPGWALLGAALREPSSRDWAESTLLKELMATTDPVQVTATLNMLAAIATEHGHRGEAARRLYLHECAPLARGEASWLTAAPAVFATIKVPTMDGAWRRGDEVAWSGATIAPSHLLLRTLADLMPPGMAKDATCC
jgi:hypothetical protein